MEENQNQNNQNTNIEKDSFFSKRKQEIAAVVGLIVFQLITGISLYLILIAGLYLIATAIMSKKPANLRSLAKLMNIILLIMFVYLGLEMFMPRMTEKRMYVVAKIDQTFSQKMTDKHQVLATDIFEEEKKKAAKDFIPYYRQLLNEGRVSEAADTLVKFETYWDYGIQFQKAKKGTKKKIEVIEKKEENNPLSQERNISYVSDSIFYPGTYVLEVSEITDFYIIPKNGKKYQYFEIDSDEKMYQLIFSNGRVYEAESKIRERNLRFRIKATGDGYEKIIMTIS